MIEIIVLCIIILFFFYKQSSSEFRINQLEWSQTDTLGSLLSEHVPIVIRSIPHANFWTQSDVQQRTCFALPIFKEMGLTEWLSSSNPSSMCPWKDEQAEKLASVSGIHVWATKWTNPLMIAPYAFWKFPVYHCWAGSVGLRKLYAHWTCIFPVDGEIRITIMPQSVHSYLPSAWEGCVPSELTSKDTPFVADLTYLDIILRPGTCAFIPAHWFVSWKSDNTVPMVCTISYHSPISFGYAMIKNKI